MIYCDNAATSFPKPRAVTDAMMLHMTTEAVNPGRSGFDLSLQAAAKIDALRARLNHFFNNPDPDPNRTIFTANATAALNLALGGLCQPGDHVIADAAAHNSVLRPLHMLRKKGRITFDLVPCDTRGLVTAAAVDTLINPHTRLVILNHASNVTGTIQCAQAIGDLCRNREILFLLDTAQTAGVLPVDMIGANIDLVVFTGHKGLLGPTGTGGLVLGPRAEPDSTLWGGTGIRSLELEQPVELPYRLEAGTLNSVGLCGLAAGLAWVQNEGVEVIGQRESELARLFAEGCRKIPGVHIWGREDESLHSHVGVVSLTCAGIDPQRIGIFLDVEWGIAVRTGLHCAPLAHHGLGTAPSGTVRFSFGPFNKKNQLPRLFDALENIARGS